MLDLVGNPKNRFSLDGSYLSFLNFFSIPDVFFLPVNIISLTVSTIKEEGLSLALSYCIIYKLYMSPVMRKLAFCICENKDADQLRSNCAADQRLVFATWIVQSLNFLNPKFQASSIFCCCTALFVWDLVGNLEDRFSHNEAHII